MQQKYDQSANDYLEKEEFELFCRELLHRPELNKVFHQYSSNSRVLSTMELRKFLNDQGEDNTLAHAQSLILMYDKWAKKNQLMMLNGFTLEMLLRENDVFNLEHTLVYQDMSQPLNHYFISSSHNTYLTKDQLVSESSTDPYIWALSHSCHCVELDCWNGDKEPLIYHGHTLTSRVSFREVVETIAEYAFKELKGKILVKGKKKQVEQESVFESSCSAEESKAEVKARAKKESKKDTLRRWMLSRLLSKLELGITRVPLDLDYMEFTCSPGSCASSTLRTQVEDQDTTPLSSPLRSSQPSSCLSQTQRS
ncbi:hypothetical protein MHYP_G00162410 [Metynnis hypsauchen]